MGGLLFPFLPGPPAGTAAVSGLGATAELGEVTATGVREGTTVGGGTTRVRWKPGHSPAHWDDRQRDGVARPRGLPATAALGRVTASGAAVAVPEGRGVTGEAGAVVARGGARGAVRGLGLAASTGMVTAHGIRNLHDDELLAVLAAA